MQNRKQSVVIPPRGMTILREIAGTLEAQTPSNPATVDRHRESRIVRRWKTIGAMSDHGGEGDASVVWVRAQISPKSESPFCL
ncbi:MAG: hypothetical protein ACF787_00040 [Rhodopirellula sp. JB053]